MATIIPNWLKLDSRRLINSRKSEMATIGPKWLNLDGKESEMATIPFLL